MQDADEKLDDAHLSFSCCPPHTPRGLRPVERAGSTGLHHAGRSRRRQLSAGENSDRSSKLLRNKEIILVLRLGSLGLPGCMPTAPRSCGSRATYTRISIPSGTIEYRELRAVAADGPCPRSPSARTSHFSDQTAAPRDRITLGFVTLWAAMAVAAYQAAQPWDPGPRDQEQYGEQGLPPPAS